MNVNVRALAELRGCMRFSLCSSFEGRVPPIVVSFLTLLSTAMLFLVFLLALRFSAVKQGRKKFLCLLKQRKTITNASDTCFVDNAEKFHGPFVGLRFRNCHASFKPGD